MSENKILTLLFNKMHLKMSSAKSRSFCLGLNVFISMIGYIPEKSSDLLADHIYHHFH